MASAVFVGGRAVDKPELTSLGRSHHGVPYRHRGTGLILNIKIVSQT